MGEGHHWSRELLRRIYGKNNFLKDALEMVRLSHVVSRSFQFLGAAMKKKVVCFWEQKVLYVLSAIPDDYLQE